MSRYRLALSFLLAAQLLAAGCGSLSSRGDESFSYEAMRRQIEGPDPSSYRPAFAQSPGPRTSKGLVDSLAPQNLTDTFKKSTGQGPKPEKAKERYAEAEAIYREAMAAEGADRQEKFAEAAEAFDTAAKYWPDSAMEQDALFLSGEAYFFADMFPEANKQYERLLKRFPNSPYLDLVEARRFSLAQYWLATAEYHQETFFSTNLFDRERPWRDTRGNGLRVFDRIRIDDPTGKLADDATMAAANHHFQRGRFIRADEYYADVRKTFPSSEHQFLAHYLGVQAKLRSYQGPDYSGVVLDEAEELLTQIRKQFPREAQQNADELNRMYREVRFRLAEREWYTAQYYEKQKAYGAARFYYDIVTETYEDTPFADAARERVVEIADKAPRPPQHFQWVVEMFPPTRDQKPLLVTRPTGTSTR